MSALTVFDILSKYRQDLLLGLLVTLKLCAVIWPSGIILGTLVGAAGSRWKLLVGIPSRVASFLLASVPILVFLFWLHYPLQAMLNVVIDPFYTSAAAITIINTTLIAELIRGVLNDFPAHYVTAAHACGLSQRDTFLRIQLPIIFRQVIPSVLTIQVTMLQSTLFASLIGVDEIFRIAQRINSEVYRPVEIYTSLAVFFLLICLPLYGLAAWLRQRYTRDYSER